MADLILLDVPANSMFGLWNGASGTVGERFLGFHSIPPQTLQLLRTSPSEALLVFTDSTRVVLTRDSTSRWYRVTDISKLESLPMDLHERMTNSGLVFAEETWAVTVYDVDRLGLKLCSQLTEEDCALVNPSPRDFKMHLSSSFSLDEHDFFLAQFDLAFALFVCIGSVHCFDVWSKMLRVLELFGHARVPARYRSALARQLANLPEDLLEDHPSLHKDLKRVLRRLVQFTDMKEAPQDTRDLCSAATRWFPDLLQTKDENEGDEDSPVIVQEAVTKSSSSQAYHSSPVPALQQDTKRMEWML